MEFLIQGHGHLPDDQHARAGLDQHLLGLSLLSRQNGNSCSFSGIHGQVHQGILHSRRRNYITYIHPFCQGLLSELFTCHKTSFLFNNITTCSIARRQFCFLLQKGNIFERGGHLKLQWNQGALLLFKDFISRAFLFT